jgi:hypothetical protein
VDTPKVTASFRMYRFYRFQMLAMVTFFVGIGAFLSVAEVRGDHGVPPLWWAIPWLVGAVVVGYLTLFRFCYRLELADNVVHWFTPLRSGWVSVAEVRGSRPAFNFSSDYYTFVEVIDLADQRPLLVPVFNRLGRQRFGRSFDPYEYANRDDVVWFLYQLEKLTPNAPMRMR